jgi:RHS repeat-associated protein
VTYVLNGQNQVTQAGSATFAYGDGRGNLTSDGVDTYGYDSANNLTSFNANTTMRSDPVGRLMAVIDSNGGVPTTASRWFRYGGAGLLAEYGMIGSDNGTLHARYVPGPGPDETVVWYNGADTSQRRWLIPDERGSVAAVADAGGNLLSTDLYDEYGIPGASNLGRMQYTGQMWIPEASLCHFKARDYSPTLGRFLQTDPAGYGDGLDGYIYAHSDPLNEIDPSGMDDDPTTVGEVVVTAPYPTSSGSGFNLWAFIRQGATSVGHFVASSARNFASFGPTQRTCQSFNASGEADCSSCNFLGSSSSQFQFLA